MAEDKKTGEQSGEKGGSKFWIVAVLLVALVGVAIYWNRPEEGQTVPATGEQAQTTAAQTSAPAPVEESAVNQAEIEQPRTPDTVAAPTQETATRVEEIQETAGATTTQPAPGEITGEPGTETPAAPEQPQGPATLELENLAGSLQLSVQGIDPSTGRLPLTYSCYRDNTTPPLAWSAAPEGTQSFALFMEQRKPDRKPYVNWVLFNIPADKTSLSAGLPRQTELSDGTRFGRNDNGVADYAGPCDPRGKVDYAIRLFALDIVLDKNAEITKDELIRTMNGHIIDEAEVTFYHVLRP